jgi:hypothetical protein
MKNFTCKDAYAGVFSNWCTELVHVALASVAATGTFIHSIPHPLSLHPPTDSQIDLRLGEIVHNYAYLHQDSERGPGT